MSKNSPLQQRGAALLTVLLLLLIMTLLGLASLRSGLLEERMTGNLYDRSVGFQTAEAALREAEVAIVARTNAYDGTDGTFPLPVADATPRWLDPNPANWRAATNLGGTSAAVTARVIVEEMGVAPTWRGCDRVIPVDPSCLTGRFRITAVSQNQAAGRAQVMLQSNYSMATP